MTAATILCCRRLSKVPLLEGTTLQFVRNLGSPFNISIPLLISRTLCVLLCAAAPTIVVSQNSPTNDKQEDMVQTQMSNVTFHLSESVAVEIKSLNGVPVPLSAKMNSPSSTTKTRSTCA